MESVTEWCVTGWSVRLSGERVTEWRTCDWVECVTGWSV